MTVHQLYIYMYIIKHMYESPSRYTENVSGNLWVTELLVILISSLQFFMFCDVFNDCILLL